MGRGSGPKAGDQPLTGHCLFYACPLGCSLAAASHTGAETMRSDLREPHCGVLSSGHVRFCASGLRVSPGPIGDPHPAVRIFGLALRHLVVEVFSANRSLELGWSLGPAALVSQLFWTTQRVEGGLQ